MTDQTDLAFDTFGQMLRHLRRRARLTQHDLGAAVGYSEAYITRLEGDSRLPIPGMVESVFVDALKLRAEPDLARRLVALAQLARDRHPGVVAQPLRLKSLTNLPAQLSRFIGRVRELEDVHRLIRDHRLVTFTGSGGVGKTRLALEAAAALAQSFPDGVRLAELAPLSEAILVPQTVARALGLQNFASIKPVDAVCAFLADKQVLIILDNCEHLIEASATFVDVVLRACPGARVLATSREAMRITGEVTWRVPPMTSADATLLFADRATAVRPGFALTHTNAASVAAISERLDGIPLAIELAASRLSGLSVEQLVSRLGDRFRLLTDGSRSALPRHRTLRAMIDWSYDLLSDQERVLFRRLAVFSGGWTADAAERVCATVQGYPIESKTLYAANVLPLLLDLVGKSLVAADSSKSETRYRFLETIREYAWEKLAAADEVSVCRQRHARQCLEFVQENAPREMRETGSAVQFALGATSASWVKMIVLDHDNVRAALRWTLTDGCDLAVGAQLAHWLYSLWLTHGPREEGIEFLERALSQPADAVDGLTRARLLTALADFAATRGDHARAEAASEEAVNLCRRLESRFDLMRALQMRAENRLRVGAFADARVLEVEWLALARALGNKRYEGIALFWLAEIAMRERDFSGAAQLYEESLLVTPAEEIGTRVIEEFYLAMIRWLWRADSAGTRAPYDMALKHFRETEFEFGVATVLHAMGDIALLTGDLDRARHCFCECLALLHRQGARQRIVWALGGLAALAAAEGQNLRAITLWSAARTLRAAVNTTALSMNHDDYVSRIEAARAALAPLQVDLADTVGRQMSVDESVAYALAD